MRRRRVMSLINRRARRYSDAVSFRQILGALIYDGPRFVRAMHDNRWVLLHNRNERITADTRGVQCEWEFTSELHIANVFPSAGARLMSAAFAQWPVML